MESDQEKTQRIKRAMEGEKEKLLQLRREQESARSAAEEAHLAIKERLGAFMQVNMPAIMAPYAAALDCTPPSHQQTSQVEQDCSFVIRYPAKRDTPTAVVTVTARRVGGEISFRVAAVEPQENDRRIYCEASRDMPEASFNPAAMATWIEEHLEECMLAIARWELTRAQ